MHPKKQGEAHPSGKTMQMYGSSSEFDEFSDIATMPAVDPVASDRPAVQPLIKNALNKESKGTSHHKENSFINGARCAQSRKPCRVATDA